MERITKRIYILTIFPDYFKGLLTEGIASQVLRGQRTDLNFEVKLVNIRQYGMGQYKAVDDYSYGGGPGMVMRPDVLERAFLEGVLQDGGYCRDHYKKSLSLIYTGPDGVRWDHRVCKDFSKAYYHREGQDLVFLCGRYEGVDQRFLDQYVDHVYSLGDYVLTGGELAVMAILDSSLRFVEQALGNELSAKQDSFEDGLLDHPHYTRPNEFNGQKVPEVLLSGHHAHIEKWRQNIKESLTLQKRPDLFGQMSSIKTMKMKE